MKLTYAILLVAFINAGEVDNKSANHLKPVIDTSRIIKDIQRDYSEITLHRKRYKELEKDLTGETTEGGFIAVYCDGDTPREIIAFYYGETGKAVKKYYFNQNGFFFAFVQEYSYNKPMYEQGAKIARIKEDRYYFNKKIMLKWVDNKKVKNIKSPEFTSESMNVSRDAEDLWRSVVDCKEKNVVVIHKRDTLRCKNGTDCPSTGYIVSGSRDICGHVVHVNPKNKNVPLER